MVELRHATLLNWGSHGNLSSIEFQLALGIIHRILLRCGFAAGEIVKGDVMGDVVILLANLMDADGRLNEESARRAAKAADVFHESQAKAIVTCGWEYRQDSAIAIADAFKRHLMHYHAIRQDQIIVESNSRDTVGDAYFTKVNIVVPAVWKRMAVVTSDYHVSRTHDIFDFVYGDGFQIEVIGAAVGMTSEAAESEQRSLEAFRSTFAGVPRGDSAAILDRLRSHHPFYNGKLYARI